MNVLIVEDEIHIARHLAKLTKRILNDKNTSIHICLSISDALEYIANNSIELLLLDLNLKGKDGFDILKLMLAESFHVIVVSAHTEKAITAFEYGVLDFVPKPFSESRLRISFNRLKGLKDTPGIAVRYFMVKKKHRLIRVNEEDVLYFEAYGHYSKIHLKDGSIKVYDKPLIALQAILDEPYERVHKSYIVKMAEFASIKVYPGGKYVLKMKNDDEIPVGRGHYKTLKKKWFIDH